MYFNGNFNPGGDKSISQRLIIMSILASGQMLMKELSTGEDTLSCLKIYETLGGKIEHKENGILITGLNGKIDKDKVYNIMCDNSGTTIRLLAGLLSGISGTYVLDGDKQLRNRPMNRVADPLRKMGALINNTSGKPPINIIGTKLQGMTYKMPNTSAQVKSAIILAALNAQRATQIIEIGSSRDHTERLVDFFGGDIVFKDFNITIKPSKLTLPAEIKTPSDPSSAAFFLTAAAFTPNSDVTAKNMLLSKTRIGFLDVLERMGAIVEKEIIDFKPEIVAHVSVRYNGPLKGVEVTKEEIPSLVDEIPILALAATQASGKTIFNDVGELRIKETDRLEAIKVQLGNLGAKINIEKENLIVTGATKITPKAELDSYGDHRLAMMLHIGLATIESDVKVKGDESINISYPGFFQDLKTLRKI